MMYDDNNREQNQQEQEQNFYSSYQISQPEQNQETPRKKKHRLLKGIAIATACTLGIGAIAFCGYTGIQYTKDFIEDKMADNHNTGKTVETVTTASSNGESGKTIQTASTSEAGVYDVSQVVENVMPSVVSITNVGTQTYNNMWGQQGTYESQSSGSGIIVGQNDTELLVVTNNHVVSGADTISVGFIDETSVNAKIKGTDSSTDLAVIAIPISDISSDTLDKIKVAVLGDSTALKVGEPAIAIGNALGYGQSVTTGVISALNREVTVDSVTNELIQTDAAINPGNSGGALLNIKGEVIGINSVKYSSTEVEGMGYSIPISTATPIINELMNKETKNKVDESESSYLGITGVDVSESVAQVYSMPVGVYVAQVSQGTAAEKAGLKKGDIITSIEGEKVSGMEDLKEQLEYYAAGTEVELEVQRANGGEYKSETIKVTLGKKTS